MALNTVIQRDIISCQGAIIFEFNVKAGADDAFLT